MLSHPLQTISLVGWCISFLNQDSNPAVRGPAPTGLVIAHEHKFSTHIHQRLLSNPGNVTYMYESKIPRIITKGRMFPKFQKLTDGIIFKQNYNYQRQITNKQTKTLKRPPRGLKTKEKRALSFPIRTLLFQQLNKNITKSFYVIKFNLILTFLIKQTISLSNKVPSELCKMISNTLIAFIYMTLKLFWAEVTDCKVTEYKKVKCIQFTEEE